MILSVVKRMVIEISFNSNILKMSQHHDSILKGSSSEILCSLVATDILVLKIFNT